MKSVHDPSPPVNAPLERSPEEPERQWEKVFKMNFRRVPRGNKNQPVKRCGRKSIDNLLRAYASRHQVGHSLSTSPQYVPDLSRPTSRYCLWRWQSSIVPQIQYSKYQENRCALNCSSRASQWIGERCGSFWDFPHQQRATCLQQRLHEVR